MPRRKKLTPAEQAQREQEALNAPVRLDGAGEAPAVKALLSPDFERMTNMDASQVALLLQEIIRGQQSMLARYDQTSLEIARLRERQDRADQEIAERMENQKKFIEETMDRAESLRRTGEAQDKLIAQGVATYQEAKTNATATVVAKRLAFEQQLAKEPKVGIVWPAQLITTIENGQQVAKIIAEEVRIRHKVWVYQPGAYVEVPRSIAEFLDQRRASQKETAQRQEMLQKNMESNKLAEAWNSLGGSSTERMPLTPG
jgi:hypothetical protein